MDFAGLLSIIKSHNKYVLVMIERFSEWIELVALHDKFSERVAYAFLNWIFSQFGASTEVLTNQGKESIGEF